MYESSSVNELDSNRIFRLSRLNDSGVIPATPPGSGPGGGGGGAIDSPPPISPPGGGGGAPAPAFAVDPDLLPYNLSTLSKIPE